MHTKSQTFIFDICKKERKLFVKTKLIMGFEVFKQYYYLKN